MSSALVIALSSCHTEALPDLIDFIKASPTSDTLEDLAFAFLDVAQTYPMNVDKIANVLISIRDMPDAPAISSAHSYWKPEHNKFRNLLCRAVFEMLAFAFTECSDPSIHPENTFLVAAMVSGACVRSGLCTSSTQAATVTAGLHFSHSEYELSFTPDLYEVNALHSCLQLLVGGSAMYNTSQMSYDKDGLLPALVSIAEKDIIQNLNGKKLLQVTIEQAKIAFTKDLSVSEIWSILFPGHAA